MHKNPQFTSNEKVKGKSHERTDSRFPMFHVCVERSRSNRGYKRCSRKRSEFFQWFSMSIGYKRKGKKTISSKLGLSTILSKRKITKRSVYLSLSLSLSLPLSPSLALFHKNIRHTYIHTYTSIHYTQSQNIRILWKKILSS